MTECEFCGEDFDSELKLQAHWREHEDELNSHQEEKVKKAERKLEEKKQQKNAERKRMLGYFTAGGAALALVIAVGLQLMSSPAGKQADGLNLEGEPMMGSPDANVTVVEFGDFQCPACRSFEAQSFSRIKQEYIDTGKVKFYWKDYPLTQIHPWAQSGAEAMECVNRQNQTAFWDVKDTLFRNQGTLSQSNAHSQITDWAVEEGVNRSDMNACLNNGEALSEVNQDISDGQSNSVTSTPTVFVNGKSVRNSYSSIKAAIEQQLR
ncbi:MAG: thioredoxin domain-containing protein [Nanohaloarchaea archaeon]|nr:thioredoxin domain-containing protein [Candidatus Nanohaloarchaea archaeon]